MEKIATYKRLSKEEQTRDGNALERQDFVIKQCLAEQGWSVTPEYEFTDIQSGRRDDRPNFQKLVKLIRQKSINVVVIERVDRFSRDTETIAQLAKLLELMAASGVQLFECYLGRSLDFSNPQDWEYFVSSGVKAEGESRKLSRRIKSNKAFYRHQGKIQGGKLPFGYQRNANGTYDLNPAQAEAARQRVRWFLETRSAVEVTRLVWQHEGLKISYQGLTRWLRSPVLRGHTPYLYGKDRDKGGIRQPAQVIHNTHPPLIDTATQQQVDMLLSLQKHRKRQRSRVYSLSGLVTCGRCGAICYIVECRGKRDKTAKLHYLQCKDARVTKTCKRANGESLLTRYELVERAVIDALRQRAKELIETAVEEESEEVESPEVQKLRAEIARVEELAKYDTDFQIVLEKKKSDLRQKLLAPAENRLRHERGMLAKYWSSANFWGSASQEELQRAFYRFVSSIKVVGNSVEVDLKV